MTKSPDRSSGRTLRDVGMSACENPCATCPVRQLPVGIQERTGRLAVLGTNFRGRSLSRHDYFMACASIVVDPSVKLLEEERSLMAVAAGDKLDGICTAEGERS